MRIQHNIPSMNAYRNYNNNANALNRNLEKLSSGYRINRAGDDAAGLAISEKMRAQITGLDAATKNVKDGISLVKTAEGAMQEVHDMLGRMKYLATQSSNGTYQDEVDRENIQKEVNSLLDEINRIADSANFNGQKLLNGELDSVGRANEIALPDVGAALGTNTRLHEDKKDAQKASYTVDLGDIKFKKRTSSQSMSADDTISIGLGNGVTVSMKIDSNASATWGADFNAADIVNAAFSKITSGTTFSSQGVNLTVSGAYRHTTANGTLAAGWYTGGSNSTDMTVNGAFSVGAGTGNSVNVSQTYDPTDATKFTVNHDVSVTGGAIALKIDPKMTYNQKTVNATAGVVETNGELASTKIQLTKDMMKFGNGLKFGNTTYTFIDGKGTGDFVDVAKGTIRIDDLLKNMENGTMAEEDALKELADRVSQAAANNDAWTVSTVNTTVKGEIMLTEKAGAATVDPATGKPKWDFSNKNAIADSIGYVTAGKGLNLQIGDTSDNYNQMKVGVTDMHAKTLGISGLDVSTADAAHTAIDKIQNAINSVSSTRGDLGAIQNRLEHTSNNLSVMKENIQDAESTIRDTDVADEMMKYTKNNILLQSAQAMLAQANQLPQGVLQLLQ